jgi:hypothetical protein
MMVIMGSPIVRLIPAIPIAAGTSPIAAVTRRHPLIMAVITARAMAAITAPVFRLALGAVAGEAVIVTAGVAVIVTAGVAVIVTAGVAVIVTAGAADMMAAVVTARHQAALHKTAPDNRGRFLLVSIVFANTIPPLSVQPPFNRKGRV